jgi:hypothetical protein
LPERDQVHRREAEGPWPCQQRQRRIDHAERERENNVRINLDDDANSVTDGVARELKVFVDALLS